MGVAPPAVAAPVVEVDVAVDDDDEETTAAERSISSSTLLSSSIHWDATDSWLVDEEEEVAAEAARWLRCDREKGMINAR